ncbi:MAG: ABC transporter ATP-binding protein, partial [Acidimicrobiia bacterium]|nr:ABC transporter ATP-binding protein [Acidimicrobiia bacterium]
SKRVADISGGMKRRLALAATLIHSPELIFLDEPTAGIDPILRRKFWDHFTSLKDEDRTLVVTTQYVGEAAYCDYVAVLADGELLMVETPDGLRRAAFGGDIIDLQLTHRPDPGLVDRIREASTAMDCQPVGVNGLRLVVEEAAIALPELSSWLGDNEIGIEQAEEWFPPFDDVFVELVSRHRTTAEPSDV